MYRYLFEISFMENGYCPEKLLEIENPTWVGTLAPSRVYLCYNWSNFQHHTVISISSLHCLFVRSIAFTIGLSLANWMPPFQDTTWPNFLWSFQKYSFEFRLSSNFALSCHFIISLMLQNNAFYPNSLSLYCIYQVYEEFTCLFNLKATYIQLEYQF